MGELLLLKEQAVIVLRLEEGFGLKNSKNHDILVSATLRGNKMETDRKKSAVSTKFDSNLVWETDKFSIKKMKTENVPIKIECFSLTSKDGNTETGREFIGSILIPVRSIPLYPLSKALQIKPRWYRLIGLSPEWRQQKPELLLYIMITEKGFLDSGHSLLSAKEPVEVSSTESVVIDPVPVNSMLSSQQGIFIRLLQDEGLLQVGNIDTKCDIFVVKLLLKNIRHLENMISLNEMESGETDPEQFHVKYDFLGNSFTCPLIRKHNRVHSMNETIVISFRSSLEQLQEYFEKIFVIPVEVFSKDTLIGSVQIRVQNHLKITNLKEFLEVYGEKDRTAQFEGSFKIQAITEVQSQLNHPFLKYNFSLKYVSTKPLYQPEVREVSKISSKSIEHEKSMKSNKSCESVKDIDLIDLGASGDNKEGFEIPQKENFEVTPEIREVVSETLLQANKLVTGKKNFKSDPNIATSTSINPSTTDVIVATTEPIITESSTTIESQNDLPHIFSYNLIIQSISLQQSPKPGIYQFSFHHERSQTLKTIISRDLKDFNEDDSKAITFEPPLELRLFFISNPDGIVSLIQSSDSCKLCVNGPKGIQTKALLDCKTLMARYKQASSGLILLENQHKEKVAMANVSVRIDDLGINYNVQQQWMNETQTNEDTGKTVLLDEDLAYKMIEDLEKWKSHEYETFLESLKEKESLYLSKLKHEWILKRCTMEQELVSKLEKYTNLTAALEEAQSCLKEKGSQYFQQEKLILKMKTDLEKSYNGQLLAMKERARRLEEDLTQKFSMEELKYAEMEMEKLKFQKENEELREFNARLQKEIKELKENFTPTDDVDNILQNMKLLNDKFEAAERSKIFYKEEWAKLLREMHKIKMQYHYQTSDQILDSKLNRICYLTEEDVNFENFKDQQQD